MTSFTNGTCKSSWSGILATYHGALAITRSIFDFFVLSKYLICWRIPNTNEYEDRILNYVVAFPIWSLYLTAYTISRISFSSK
jgi:hypothetical protein